MPVSEGGDKSIGLEAREILAALSNNNSLNIFNASVERIEASFGLSGLKPASLYKTWGELSFEAALSLERAKSEIYCATRYFDFRVAEAGLRAAARGCKLNIIHSARSGLSTKLQLLGNLMTHPKAVKIFRASLHNPNVSEKEAEFSYSFIVADSLTVGLEVINPEDPQSFFLGLKFESPLLASRLITHFRQISKDATEETDVLGDAVERVDPNR